ncbi:hypothetical protein [Octadecabacter ascidiaceicola]|uniref:DUF2125 domain-containing protein n=1 Tax=Octadecabacter ascidiaceicola TaxID=1655543 RepID=A0A238K5U4_9RHOB|nr:hypothetical protein [Octadecabacter ascidiaceicola]SMX37472.1 hypothetical protein OCA8868_01459 [Octadecabacter ascidiaceicola]
MKYFIPTALVAMMAMPADAFERMMRSDCQVGFEKLAELMQPDDTSTAAMSNGIRVTPQGWCEMRGGTAGLEDAEFGTLEWRAEGVTRWTRDGIPPLALEVRITGLDPDEMQGGMNTGRPNVDVEVLLRQLPDAGMIVIERAVMENNAGDSMTVSGVFERVFLSSPSMMQVSMGSAAFKAGLISLTLEGTHENPFGFGVDVEMRGVPQAQRDAAFDLISKLPDGVVDDASRAELTAFAGDLPKPVGTLEVSVSSAQGLGLMQVGMWMYNSLEAVISDDVDGSELEILLHGISVEADWAPDAQVAD